MRTYQTTITKYTWIIWGIETNRPGSTFENCYITDTNCSKEEILLAYNITMGCGRYTATDAMLESIEYVTIDLMNNKIIHVETEKV